jgi:hypothetical protein
MSLVAELAKPFAGLFNRARLGFPRYYFQGTGGIGDDLMCTAVFRELKKRGAGRIAATTQHPGLFQHNPDVDAILFHPRPRLNRWLREGLPFLRLGYAAYDPVRDADAPLDEHVLIKICRLAGVAGTIALRPYLYLTPEELTSGKIAERQIVIQSSAQGAPWPMKNKEWYQDRLQSVCARLAPDFKIIQIGATSDPKLDGVVDLRGKTTIRQSAALLANARVFIGLEGFLMHLARSVDCRSVIIYGGRIAPWQIGYIANENLYSAVECSPCWLRNQCDHDRKCMDIITVEQVLAAARRQIQKHGTPLEVEKVIL